MANAIVLVNGFPTTGITSGTTANSIYDYPATFAVKTNKPGEVVLTEMLAANDQPFKARYALSDVKDIYKGTGITPSYQSGNREGTSLLISASQVLRKEMQDGGVPTDPTYRVDLPFDGHFVLKFPKDGAVTAAHIAAFFANLLGLAKDSAGVLKIETLIKGALTPSGL